jgi:transcriptional regulator with XRE-family HTH domain
MKGNIDPKLLQDNREYLGAWLKQRREAKELSQGELAEKMGVRQETVSKVETGKWAISIDMLTLFGKYLGFTIKQLLDRKVKR